MRYRERLSSRILDRAIRVPGCSRAVSKWISRSRECESTCIIASGCDSERARRLFRVNARVTRPSTNMCCRPLQDGDGRTVPLAYRDIIYPHMSIYSPSIRNGSVGRRGSPAVLRYQEGHRDIVSSRDGRPLSFIALFVMSWWMKYLADFRYSLLLAKF